MGEVLDPLTPIIGPWGQFGIVGAVVVALGWAVVHLWHKLHAANDAHLAEVRRCGDEMREMAIKKIESDHKLANALEGVEKIVQTALDTMRR